MPAKNTTPAKSEKTKGKSDNKSTKKQKEEDIEQIERNCSFCGRSSKSAFRMIAGPNNIFICEECISVCIKIFSDEGVFMCPYSFKKTSNALELLGSNLHIPKDKKGRIKYDVLYLSPNTAISEKFYTTHIQPLAEFNKVKVKYVTMQSDTRFGFDKEIIDIYNCSFIMADVSGKTPDIMYLLGMVNLIDKPVFFITQKPEDIPNSVNNDFVLFYDKFGKSLTDNEKKVKPFFAQIKKLKNLTRKLMQKKGN